MPVVRVEASEFGNAVDLPLDDGGSLLDACDAGGAPVPFSCRSASCGTCRVEVLEGLAHFDPAGADELEVLAAFDAPPNHRLACRAWIRTGAGRVVLRSVND